MFKIHLFQGFHDDPKIGHYGCKWDNRNPFITLGECLFWNILKKIPICNLK
jgi:hypothetical protein